MRLPSFVSREFIVTAKIDRWFLILLYLLIPQRKRDIDFLNRWIFCRMRESRIFFPLRPSNTDTTLYCTITSYARTAFIESIREELMSKYGNIVITDFRLETELLVECLLLRIRKFLIFSCHYYKHFCSSEPNLINLMSQVWYLIIINGIRVQEIWCIYKYKKNSY